MKVFELRDKLTRLVECGEGDLPVCSNTFDGWIDEVSDGGVNVMDESIGKGSDKIRMLMISA